MVVFDRDAANERRLAQVPILLGSCERSQLRHSWGVFAVDSHNPVKHAPKWGVSLATVPEDSQRPRQ